MKKYAVTIKIALLTASAVILFQVISLLTVYQYVRTDLYLSLVAICFLTAGLLIARRPAIRPFSEMPATATSSDNLAPSQPILLTQREQQILKLIAEGRTNKEIAAVNFVEISTVKTHVNNIYTKLAVSNRVQARLKYAEMAGERAD